MIVCVCVRLRVDAPGGCTKEFERVLRKCRAPQRPGVAEAGILTLHSSVADAANMVGVDVVVCKVDNVCGRVR